PLVLVDAGCPGPVLDSPYDTEDSGVEGHTAEVRDAASLQGLEQLPVVKARVEAGSHRHASGDAPQALVDEGQQALGGVDPAPPQLGVQADAEPRDEAHQGMQGVALQVGRIRTLAARGAGSDV